MKILRLVILVLTATVAKAQVPLFETTSTDEFSKKAAPGTYLFLTNDTVNLPVIPEDVFLFIEKNRQQANTVILKYSSQLWIKVVSREEITNDGWVPLPPVVRYYNDNNQSEK